MVSILITWMVTTMIMASVLRRRMLWVMSNFLADTAHARNLSVGLKNAGEIIPQVLGRMQWAVNEQRIQYGECDTWQRIVEAGKPVFYVEYSDGAPNVAAQKVGGICGNVDAKGFETVLKEMGLDNWVEACPFE